jgi:phosphatidylinositol alpha-1,6-mannosyltransferase
VDGIEIDRIHLSRSRFLRPESLALYANLLIHGAAAVRRLRPTALVAARALPEGLVATTLGRLLRVPTAVFAHGEEITPWVAGAPAYQRRRGTAFVKGRMLWRTYRKADLIIANSRFTRGLLTGGGIAEEKVALVHPGTDPDVFKPMPRDEAWAAALGLAGRKVLLTVGRLMWRKGQDMVIQALPEILKAVPGTVYLVCGTGPYESGLRELAQSLGLGPHVIFLGEVAAERLPALYNLADLFVMPNRVSLRTRDTEGFGIVFLEANACEVPVIGGRSGGVPDAVADGETGLLVDGTDPHAIAGAVARILTESGLAARMGKAGRRRVCDALTWDRGAETLRAALDRLRPAGNAQAPSASSGPRPPDAALRTPGDS